MNTPPPPETAREAEYRRKRERPFLGIPPFDPEWRLLPFIAGAAVIAAITGLLSNGFKDTSAWIWVPFFVVSVIAAVAAVGATVLMFLPVAMDNS
ncbi:MAG: hypothetical protein A2Y84_00730 [Candidatus Colwellbacteria bacterium RBG_13_48_8]|uniref:Uncharacterized protein n=1 Tax=Candidatus Colwellbacteria bacterium RBG_13_48_8 TaxID=1797685 RepID=A0A1G1YX46_9BACT|nr:MAG: hypothetical protein A2Y84_00730 [Candidatus Colwellbacteria bacterium RBG_13_48_8]